MSRIWESLFSKNGLAAKQIAEELIPIEEGGRIPRVEDFVKKLSLGRGTVQGALKVLENLHAVELESRGHLGTFMIKKDTHLLKEIAGVGELIGAMPLPYSRLYEGLATGLIEISEQMLNRINLAYMRGAKQRIDRESSGGRVSNTWATCLTVWDNLGKPGLIPDNHPCRMAWT